MSSIIVVHAPSAVLATSVSATVTVEAEYGSVVVEGAAYTAAHHQRQGPFAGRHIVAEGRPAPCNDDAIPTIAEGTILVSHFDLDTLGGVLRAMGACPVAKSFWDLAEYVDVSGPHKLGLSGASAADVARLRAFWAWSQANRVQWPRDAVTDITEYVHAAKTALEKILADDPAMLAAGREMAEKEAALNAASFVCLESGVISRRSDTFVNHLYVTPYNWDSDAVVSHNTKTGAITLSLAEPIEGVSCREIVQRLWGPEAGGHAGIAGSPRERVMTDDDFKTAREAMTAAVVAAKHYDICGYCRANNGPRGVWRHGWECFQCGGS